MHLRASPHGEKRVTSKVYVFELIPSNLLGHNQGNGIHCMQVGTPTPGLALKTNPAQSACHRKLPTSEASCKTNAGSVSKSTHVLTRTSRQSSPCLLWATNPQSQNNIDTSASPNSVVNFTWGCMRSLDEQGPVRFDVHKLL